MGRISTLDDHPELRDMIAVLWHEGLSNQAIADRIGNEYAALEPSVRSIIRWRKDDEVEEKVKRLAKERITRIVRLTDNALLSRLANKVDELDVDDLIKIRKALMPNVDAFTDEKQDKAGIVAELFKQASDNPEFAERLKKAAERASA